MGTNFADKKPDISVVFVSDRGEPLAVMEPMRLGEGSAPLAAARELAFDLAKASAGLRSNVCASRLVPLLCA